MFISLSHSSFCPLHAKRKYLCDAQNVINTEEEESKEEGGKAFPSLSGMIVEENQGIDIKQIIY